MMAGNCVLLAGAVCLLIKTSGGSGEAQALCFYGSFDFSPGNTENGSALMLVVFAKQKNFTDEQNRQQDDLTLLVLLKHVWFLSKRQFTGPLYQVWRQLPAVSSQSLGCSPCRQRKQHPGGLSAWMINSEGTF